MIRQTKSRLGLPKLVFEMYYSFSDIPFAVLFGRAGAGSDSEQPHLKRRYINACNELINK